MKSAEVSELARSLPRAEPEETHLSYFKLFRANVRVKVMTIDAQKNPDKDQPLKEAIVTYLQRMQAYVDRLGSYKA